MLLQGSNRELDCLQGRRAEAFLNVSIFPNISVVNLVYLGKWYCEKEETFTIVASRLPIVAVP
jgi:hypothetical protein